MAVLRVKGANAFSADQFARVPTIAWYVSNEASAVVPDDFPGLTFEVENEDGWTVLYVTLNQVVTQVVDNSGADYASKFHQAATWSNNKTPAQNAGADFYSNVGCYLPPTGVPETEVYHFPGRSMTVRKTLTFSSRGIIDFDQLNIYTGSTGTQTMRAWVFGLQVFTGNLRLVGNNDYLFTLGNNTTQRWESAISGHCNVIVGIRKPDANSQGGKEKCCEFGLTGDNTNFTGKWTVRHNSSDIENPTQFMMFAVCESRNLGAPFKTYQYDALTIKNWQALKPGRAESVLDDMTRGINFAGGHTQVVAPPEWMDYGTQLPSAYGGTYALPMKQPFFPVVSHDAKLPVTPGETVLVGSGVSQGKTDETEFIFVRTRKLDYTGRATKAK